MYELQMLGPKESWSFPSLPPETLKQQRCDKAYLAYERMRHLTEDWGAPAARHGNKVILDSKA